MITLPSSLALDLYLLACAGMRQRLHALYKAVNDDGDSVHVDAAFEAFNRALRRFFEDAWAEQDWGEATSALAGNLAAAARRLKKPGAKSVINAIADDVRAAAPPPPRFGDAELRRLSDAGRAVALAFYQSAQNRWPNPALLSLQCDVVVNSVPQGTVRYPPNMGNRLKSLVDVSRGDPAGGAPTITVRFSPDWNLDHYWCLPMCFMHEYASHVFAADDNRSDAFNDGWLFYCSAAFLTIHPPGPAAPDLCHRQLQAPFDLWEQKHMLTGKARDGWNLARELMHFSDYQAAGLTREQWLDLLNALTFEMASRPGTELGQDFYGKFLYCLKLLADLKMAADPIRLGGTVSGVARQVFDRLAP